MRRQVNPKSPEEVRRAIQRNTRDSDDIAGGLAAHVTNYDHDTFDTAYGWGDHAGLYDAIGTAATLVSSHETTYDHDNYDDITMFFNGTFKEEFDAIVTEAGGVVTMSLEASVGGDLTMQFSDGNTTLVCTPADTIELTPGTDASPTANFVFIPQASKVLTVDTDWPHGTEHIKVGYFFVPTAAFVGDHGVYINQNWNDMLAGDDGRGHLVHITTKLRHLGATWHDGVSPDGETVSYYTLGNGATDWISTAGTIEQLHHQVFAVVDTTGDGILMVKNWFEAPYTHIDNLFDIVADSADGGITNNKYFNLVFWGVANKGGEFIAVMVNLPSGIYTVQSDATTDNRDYSDFSIPREFNVDSGVAFLICRTTFKMGATWTHIETEDLRGLAPSSAAGGIGISDHGSLGGLADDDHAQYHNDARAATWLAGAHETTYNHGNYDTAYGWGDHAGVYVPIANDGKVKVDSGATGDYLGAAFNDGALRTSTGITLADSGSFITLTTNDGEIAHDNLSGFDSNDHIDHTTITLTAGTGITGGGTIAASRSFALDISGLAADTIVGGDEVAFHDDTGGHVNKTTFTNFNAALDHGGLLGLADDDHSNYHTDGRAATWLAANHETTYDHSLIGADPVILDDVAFDIGTGVDYWFIYNSTGTQFELWSTNVDGGGADGVVFSVDDGTDDVSFSGEISIGGSLLTMNTLRTVYNAEAAGFTGSLFIGDGGGDLLHTTLQEGYRNVGIGQLALNEITTGQHNNAFGFGAMRRVTTGEFNSAFGSYSLAVMVGGDQNMAMGYSSLSNLTSGNYNVAVGRNAGRYIATGTDPLTTAGSCLYIGTNTRALADSALREMALGPSAVGHGDDTITIGGASNTDVYFTGFLRGNGSLLTGLPGAAILDDAAFDIGTSVDYWFIYNSSGAAYEFWSTNVGSGVDGIIFSVDDGDDEVQFTGVIRCAGMAGVGTGSGTGTSGTSGTGKGLHGISTSGYALYAQSGSGAGIYGKSDSSYCGWFYRNKTSATAEILRLHQAHVSNTTSKILAAYQAGRGTVGLFDRLNASSTLDVVQIYNEHATDAGTALNIRQYGTGSICKMHDSAVLVVDFKDGGDVDFTNIVKAGGYKSSDGTAGATADYSIAGAGTLHVKNGLVTGYTP